MTLFGIKNCDTVRKARRWLDNANIQYQFHDVREQPLTAETLQNWLDQVGEKTLLNTRSTTWRNLPEEDKGERTPTRTIQLLQDHPTLMKRPVLVHEGKVEVGFKEARYAELFA
ncbi:ArsC family reductase [Aliidiomarina taiwanensis]|uniref:ArsC family reductase n=1 Tax=Aliidiomarina taiwanensis TaxID=946228 RepID=A0A432XAG1_9GAMM|nr:ArsC family reductase [Aliidiomarina taiwanensis]RUO44314.1 ArsC family reductase [Aliidiomarina taiwanensis]